MKSLCVALIALILVSAQAKEAANKRVVQSLEQNLKKVETSIEVTRRRLKAQKETRFAPDLFFTLGELLRDRAVVSATLKKEKNAGVPEGELDFSIEKRYTQEAIENFKLIEDRYPNYQYMDRVLFTLANEYRGLANDNEALAYFKKITEKFPTTEYAGKAFIEIGNIFMSKKDYEYALKNYDSAKAMAKGVDLFKLEVKRGACLGQLDRWSESLKSFERVFLMKKVDSTEAEDLVEEALVASVLPLLELTPAETAKSKLYSNPLEYYRRVSGDKGRYRRVLARLYQRFEIKKREREGIMAALELFRLSDSVQDKKEAFEFAYTHMKKEKDAQFPEWMVPELRKLLSWIDATETGKKKNEDLKRYEPVFRDLVTTINAQGNATGRPEDLKNVAEAYRDYFLIYPNSKFAQQMRVNEAEALFRSKQESLAGQAYWDLTTKFKLNNAQKKEYTESSLEAFLKTMSDENANYVDRVQSRDGYREVGNQFLKAYKGDKKTPEVEFNIVRTYYEERDFDQVAKRSMSFIAKYPTHEQTKAAALLYLDCYYLRDQMNEMSAAGQRLLKMPGLTQEVRQMVSQASQAAQMKAMRSIAGEYGSKDYATKFREFARKNKNSTMGENALFEAFNSLKAKTEPQAFEIGEEYVATYGKTQRVKEVLLGLSQLALILVDYQRAASYMASYAQRFPQEAEAKKLSAQAAVIYEYSGATNEAVEAYKMAGDLPSALRFLFKAQDWKLLNSVASQVSGVMGQYYQGISLVRMNQANGYTLVDRVVHSQGGSQEEKEMVGHAAILVGEKKLKDFQRDLKPQVFSAGLLQQKSAEYQELTRLFQIGVNSGGGSWVIGGLYNIAMANKLFADFLGALQPPAGMSSEQLAGAVSAQVQGYLKTSKDNRATCMKLAEENELFSNYVQGCRGQMAVNESMEFSPWMSTGSRSPASLGASAAAAIKQNPRSVPLLRQLAGQEIKSGRYQTALLVLSRASELAANDSLNDSYVGAAYLHLKQYPLAQIYFNKALSKDPKDGLAIRGLASMAKNFGFEKKAASYAAKKAGTQGDGSLHPWLN